MSSKTLKEKNVTKENEYASFLDNELRPSNWQDYVGQKAVKENLKILIQAATERGVPPEHVLFYGPPGLGKTTLAHLVAKEAGRTIKITSGPAIEKVGDLASILTNLTAGDILFIDEVHRLNKTIEEVLYPAMESGVLDIIIGKGPSARTIQLELPPFTLLAATTRVAMISSPLRSRFSGGVFRLEFYTEDEIAEILRRSAKIIGVKIENGAEKEIAKRSRFTPRTANYLLKRARDFAQVEIRPLDQKTVELSLKLLGIDEKGLSPSDRKLLEIVAEKFAGGPVGLSTLAAALSEEEATIEEFNEPYLLQLGLIERTARGRALTVHAYKHLGKTPPANLQKKLL
ncbi:MAG: Holliday junction DNA helicase RuvB [Candidatus Zambryskibacteria bacterium RIFOXYD2_FULL_43_10]|uniref:Holliday junction branch migration complex subunit RuvB n=1 Tax=Candidatus Zambryskibacteria bacterium RIFOXYD2_FULL_43_10 TaxID=1802782 RepID=A0A1G2V5Z9_9BACT|nr:MAG: Holliday junction DNA helicase RuvB [Candidatus Zambryskibacteria bacterium RIFOXYD2_FULL_43_10]